MRVSLNINFKFGGLFIKISQLFTKTEYTVAYRFSKVDILEDTNTPFIPILREEGTWCADPFPVKYNGEYYVFMEVFEQNKGYASIGYSKLSNGVLNTPKIIINTKSHMSFPLIFERNTVFYMIPETSSNSCIQIYRCKHFPDIWVPESVIAIGGYYDTVPFTIDDCNYAFSSLPTQDMYGSSLFLMNLDKSYKLTDKCFITEDYRFSRQAGNILNHNNKLIRVAQNCSNNDYGHNLEFLEMIFDKNYYSEKHIKTLMPNEIKTTEPIKGISGIHTYNRVDDFEVIDFKLRTFSISSTVKKFKIIFDFLISKIFKKI